MDDATRPNSSKRNAMCVLRHAGPTIRERRYDMFNSGITGPPPSSSFLVLTLGFTCEQRPSIPILAVINGSVVRRSPSSGLRTGDGTDPISYFIYLHATRRTDSRLRSDSARIYEVRRGKRCFPLARDFATPRASTFAPPGDRVSPNHDVRTERSGTRR